MIRSEKGWDRESRFNIEYFKPFHDEDGVLVGDGRRGKGHGVRLLASGEAMDHLSSQVGSLIVGKLVFGSRSARCGRSQKNWYRTNWSQHRLYGILYSENPKVSVWPSYATRNSNQAPMFSAFMIEYPLRLNNEHNNRGRLCNEKYSYTGAEKKEEKNVLRMRLEYTHTLPAGETQIFVKNACRRLTSNFAWRGLEPGTLACSQQCI